MNKGLRLKWLDISRGIAFLIVIYSHLEYKDDMIMRYFKPMFLTMFFFVSGYLFKEKCSFSKVFEQRTRTLLLPFLILGLIMIWLSHILTFNEHVSIIDEIKGLLFQNGQNQILWFIAALYIYSIIFYWVERFTKSNEMLLGICFILFILNAIYSYWLKGPSIPWHITAAGYACFYMALGKFYKYHESKIDTLFNYKIIVVIAAVYVGFISLTNISCSFSGSIYIIDSLVLSIMSLIIGIAISKRYFQNSRFLLFVGANTLFYFAFHGKVYSLLQILAGKMLDGISFSQLFLLHAIVGGLITFLDALILIIPTLIVNKYFSYILGKGFKLWHVN